MLKTKLDLIEFEFVNYLGFRKRVAIEDKEQLKELEKYSEEDLMKRLKSTARDFKNVWVNIYINGKLVHKKYNEMF